MTFLLVVAIVADVIFFAATTWFYIHVARGYRLVRRSPDIDGSWYEAIPRHTAFGRRLRDSQNDRERKAASYAEQCRSSLIVAFASAPIGAAATALLLR